jgi:hypothetical protein
MLLSGSGDQLCSPLVALLWRWLFTMQVYWSFHTGGLFICAPPSLVQVQCSFSPFCCLCVMTVCCLFFSFAEQLGFRCCSLAQKMNSVICYLPCFREWLITHPPSCLSSVCLLIVPAETSSLPFPLPPVHLQHSRPLCCCARLQLSVCYSGFFFLGRGVSLPRDCAG